MFSKILIANRGEIAVRVIIACREMGIKTVAVFSEADQHARHVLLSDEAWKLEGQPAKVYLDIDQIVDLAVRSGAQAIHPGYGFLSENPLFASACQAKGLIFIGPKAEVIEKMGSKVESRRLMEKAGVPVVPGTTDPVTEAVVVKELGTKYGYPIAIKASAGGGGRGLKVVRSEAEVDAALAGAQREGASYFGNNQVYVEKYLDHPRHIEVQILADQHGNVVHLGERDCSSQRRHQKLLEETPAANLDPGLRQRLLAAAVQGAKSIGYTSAGTVECLVAGNEFYFLEVNTRVQVEHPITEFVTGIDIVKEQISIAAGNPLSFRQEEVLPRGHAIECRINAEDPGKGFLPAPGTITVYEEPHFPWVRVDSACYTGYQVLPFYDSLLSKLVVWGRTRQEAIARTKLALSSYKIEGVATTIPFHLLLLEQPEFINGSVYTTYVESRLKDQYMKLKPAAASAALDPGVTRKPARNFEVNVNQRHFTVTVSELVESQAESKTTPAPVKTNGNRLNGSAPATNGSGEIRSLMHGVVKELFVKDGDTVSAGQKLLIFEAMKMESEIFANKAGRITLKVKTGETVEASGLLAVLGES